MLFGFRSRVRFILPQNLHLQFKKCFSIFLQGIPDFAAKFFIILLCFTLLLTGSNHVICMELSEAGISSVHFQHDECKYSQNRESAISQAGQEDKLSRLQLPDLSGPAPSFHDCVDEHILFEKTSAGIDFSPAIFHQPFPPENQSSVSRYLPAPENFSVLQDQRLPLFSLKSSVIRSTILLI